MAVAVGQCLVSDSEQKESGSAMRGAHVRSTNAGAGASVAEGGEGVEDSGKSGSCSADVLPIDEGRGALLDDAEALEEEARAGAVEAGALPCDGEVLARAAEMHEVHQSTKRACVEGGNVRPHRARSQGAFVHAREKDGGGVGFDFDVGDGGGGAHGVTS